MSPDLLARVHFSGSVQLLADTNAAAKLLEIAALPETQAWKEDALKKLATAPYRFLKQGNRLPDGATDQAALIRPLLDDLAGNESYLELRGPTNPVPEMLLAVHLSKDRIALWRTNISTVLAAWTGLPITSIQVEGFAGWELKKHKSPNLVRFVGTQDWAVFAWGDDSIQGLPGMVQKIKNDGRPVAAGGEQLEAWVDWPRLESHVPGAPALELPVMDLSASLKDAHVRTRALLKFPAALNLTLPEWKIPTNLLRDPIVSFTAARGIAPLLAKVPLIQQLQPNPMPNEAFIWAMSQIPFETRVAMPVPNATNFVDQVGSKLISLESSNIQASGFGELDWNPTHRSVFLKGFSPFISPYLASTFKTNGDYALLGLWPSRIRTNPVPRELLDQVTSQTNLVCYDWEFSGERLAQWNNLVAVYCIGHHEIFSTTNAPAQKWMLAASQQLGDCVTAATLTAPDEITVTRRSALGLTAMELEAFMRWEDATNFPLDARYGRLQFRKRPSVPAGGPASNLPSAKPQPSSNAPEILRPN